MKRIHAPPPDITDFLDNLPVKEIISEVERRYLRAISEGDEEERKLIVEWARWIKAKTMQ